MKLPDTTVSMEPFLQYITIGQFINRSAQFLKTGVVSMCLSKAGQADYKPDDPFINWRPVYKPVRCSQHIHVKETGSKIESCKQSTFF